jgi:hypothetical protein
VANLKEQCICFNFALNQGKNAMETFEMLKVCFGEETMGGKQVFEWFSKFKSSVTSVEDAKCLGCPLTSKRDENVDRENGLVHKNGRITIREVANMLEISYESVQSILKGNVYMCGIAAEFVPCLLSEEQNENHVSTCQDLQGKHERDPEFLLKIITGGETWVYRYDPETKQQSS